MSSTTTSSTTTSSTTTSSTTTSSTTTSRARERFTTRGADDPDQLIGVPAGELLEWGWLIGALGDWLADAPDSTGTDAVAIEFSRYFAGHLTRHDATWMLNHIA